MSLSRDSRALLEAARGGDDPTAAARAKVRAELLARVGVAGAAGASAGASSGASPAPAAGATGTGAGLAIKALFALALVGGAGATYWALRGNPPAAPAIPSTEPAQPAEAAAVVTPLPNPQPLPIPQPSPPSTPALSPPAPPPSPSPSRSPARPTPDAIRAERALLASAHTALRTGDTAAALAILADHASRFPRGLLVEERAATQVRALCAAGETARADAARAAFLRRWPRSIHAARVRVTCAPE